jgi:flavin-dependent dehydrogenase
MRAIDEIEDHPELDNPNKARLLRAIGQTLQERTDSFAPDAFSPVELRSKYEAAVLLRSRFDTLLAYEAAGRGAKLLEGMQVRELVREGGKLVGVRCDRENIEADAVIVCNGGTSKLAPGDRKKHFCQRSSMKRSSNFNP